MSTVLTNFETWKKFLGERVAAAKNMGLSEDVISKLAFEIGEFLHNKIDPQNDEERILKQLWDVGDESERKVIARMMVKLTEKTA